MSEENVITRMFNWWNEAYQTSGFSAEGFAQFFTMDAPFIVNGNIRGVGPAEISVHFQGIQANTDEVRLITPVDATLSDASLAFVHYRATFRASGTEGLENCMALARLEDGKIASFEVIGQET